MASPNLWVVEVSLSYVRYAVLNELREWLFSDRAIGPAGSELRRVRVVVVVALPLLAITLSVCMGHLVSAAAPVTNVPIDDLLVIVESSTVIAGLILAILAAVSLCASLTSPDERLMSFPVHRSLVRLPDQTVELAWGLWYATLVCAPGMAFLAAATGRSWWPTLVSFVALLSLFFLGTCLVTAMLCAIARLIRALGVHDIASGLTIAVSMVVIIGCLLGWKEIADDGVLALYAWRESLGRIGPLVAARQLIFETSWAAQATCCMVGPPVSLLLMLCSSWSMTSDAMVSRVGGPHQRSEGSDRNAGARVMSSALPPYLKREIICVLREPGSLLRSLMGSVVILAVLAYAIPERSAKIVMFIIYSLPLGLCSAILLQSVGREGNLILFIKQAGGTDRFLDAKAWLGGLIVTVLSLLLAGGILLVMSPDLERFRTLAILGLLPFATAPTVLLSLGFGTVFALFEVRRIHKHRNVSLAGELLFSCAGGSVPLAFYLFADGVLRGRAIGSVVGLVLILCVSLLALVMYRAGKSRLLKLE